MVFLLYLPEQTEDELVDSLHSNQIVGYPMVFCSCALWIFWLLYSYWSGLYHWFLPSSDSCGSGFSVSRKVCSVSPHHPPREAEATLGLTLSYSPTVEFTQFPRLSELREISLIKSWPVQKDTGNSQATVTSMNPRARKFRHLATENVLWEMLSFDWFLMW